MLKSHRIIIENNQPEMLRLLYLSLISKVTCILGKENFAFSYRQQTVIDNNEIQPHARERRKRKHASLNNSLENISKRYNRPSRKHNSKYFLKQRTSYLNKKKNLTDSYERKYRYFASCSFLFFFLSNFYKLSFFFLETKLSFQWERTKEPKDIQKMAQNQRSQTTYYTKRDSNPK